MHNGSLALNLQDGVHKQTFGWQSESMLQLYLQSSELINVQLVRLVSWILSDVQVWQQIN